MSNTSSELPLPSTTELPRYTWDEREQFAALVLSLGGSSDTHGADLCDTDRAGHHGRYPRNYTSSGQAADGTGQPSDVPGQTISFFANTMRSSEAAPRGCVALIGAPWATKSKRDATYAWLSEPTPSAQPRAQYASPSRPRRY